MCRSRHFENAFEPYGVETRGGRRGRRWKGEKRERHERGERSLTYYPLYTPLPYFPYTFVVCSLLMYNLSIIFMSITIALDGREGGEGNKNG